MSNPEPGFISLQQAIDMTTRYRNNMTAVIDPLYAGRDILCISDTFNKAAVATLVNKAECQLKKVNVKKNCKPMPNYVLLSHESYQTGHRRERS